MIMKTRERKTYIFDDYSTSAGPDTFPSCR